MFSFRFMNMQMQNNNKRGVELSDYEVISLPNPFAMGNMPSNLSVVPKKMEMKMSMMGFMYGFNDRVNGMLMLNYVNNHMLLNTYSPVADLPCIKIYPTPPECRSLLGSFTTSSSNFSHFSSSILIKLKETNQSRWQIELGFIKSIGKNNQKEFILKPELLGLLPINANDIIGGNDVDFSAKIFMNILINNATEQQNNVVCSNAAIAISTSK